MIAEVEVVGVPKVKLVDIDLVKGLVKVLLRVSFEELSLGLSLGYFGNRDRAELIEAPVSNLTVEYNFLRHDIRTVDVAEDSDVFRATAKRKGDSEGVAVTARKQAVL